MRETGGPDPLFRASFCVSLCGTGQFATMTCVCIRAALLFAPASAASASAAPVTRPPCPCPIRDHIVAGHWGRKRSQISIGDLTPSVWKKKGLMSQQFCPGAQTEKGAKGEKEVFGGGRGVEGTKLCVERWGGGGGGSVWGCGGW